ncbi:hypothetical protein [Arthrobacter pityocampae]|uniref:hypothetical protein n=1 Tax=Arthrobacter pityocampae TaxID=547334 RepID=UPI00373531C2
MGFTEGTEAGLDEAVELPIHVRATRVRREGRSLILRRKRVWPWLVYDVRYRNGEVQHDVDLSKVLMHGRYPADFWSTRHGADAVAGTDGAPGRWVDYPYGHPLTD